MIEVQNLSGLRRMGWMVWLPFVALASPAAQGLAEAEASGSDAAGSTWIRVGLATDQLEVLLTDRHGLQVLSDDELVIADAPRVQFRPAGTLVHPWTYRLQVAAVREPDHAERMARELQLATGLEPDLAFDAGSGLTRVRLGAWNQRDEAEREQARLGASGREAWVVEEPGLIQDGGLEVEASAIRTTGAGVRVRRVDGGPITWNGATYRGELGLNLNRRGELNIVLYTDVEDYLRGVVPREMGPRVYDDLEALKAQAVAARSYVLHNLGEFEDEGFDVCATARCQVFGGMAAEHPLTDQAIRETAGLVLMTADGEAADTLYTATCGGHTEDVATIFPAKHHDYLQGVPCVEGPAARITTRANWNLIESRVVTSLVGDLGSNPQEIGESFQRLMERAGVPAAEDTLESLQRDEVRRFLGSVLDLVADPAWLAGVAPHIDAPPLARSLHRVASGQGAVPVVELRRILYQAGEVTGLVGGSSVGFASFDKISGEVTVRDGGRQSQLPAGTPWHWRGSGASRLTSPGDPLDLIVVEGDPRAVLVPTRRVRNERQAPGTRVWSEYRSDRDLARRSAREFPGFEFASLELGDRGVSGRLRNLVLHGSVGSDRVLEGLPIRWFLEVPETWFDARRAESGKDGPGWVFDGRGWGHGVGMCQRGAYRMSLRGARFDEILGYYYSGLELELYDGG